MEKELLLQSYFSNSLTKEQRILFDQLLEEDASFLEQFNFEKNLKRVIAENQKQELKTKITQFETEISSKSVPVKIFSAKKFQKWYVAASIVLLIGIGSMAYYGFSGPNYDNLYDNNFQTYPNTVFEIARGESIESLEREAFTAYELKDYKTAIEKFDKISESDDREYLDFYMGISYLNLNQLDRAETFLSKTIAENADFTAEAHWYLAMTYLKMKEKRKAIVELDKLVKGYDYNRERATILLSELE